MAINADLYDNLRDELPEKAARVIAEAIPSSELVTKDYLDEALDRLYRVLETDRAERRAEHAEMEARMLRWMWGFFAPLWVGVYGTLAAVVVAIVQG